MNKTNNKICYHIKKIIACFINNFDDATIITISNLGYWNKLVFVKNRNIAFHIEIM